MDKIWESGAIAPSFLATTVSCDLPKSQRAIYNIMLIGSWKIIY